MGDQVPHPLEVTLKDRRRKDKNSELSGSKYSQAIVKKASILWIEELSVTVFNYEPSQCIEHSKML
jgi:hypothetical protein